MIGKPTLSRRQLLTTLALSTGLTGCLGTEQERPGVIDPSDINVQTNSSAQIDFTAIENDSDTGLEISTNDSINDGEVVSELPVTLSEVSSTTLYILTDVDSMDDDAEIELRFLTSTGYRTIFIGNEFKNDDQGVLATETGTGYDLKTPFQQLPKSTGSTGTNLENIQFRIRDGDFTGKIWSLVFIHKDKTTVII
jgi:hypothetical protein